MPGPVERWLETFMCKQYADTFEVYGFKTLQSVCQLQLPQLQAMGVAQEHCEMILDNVHVLRQSLFGTMNHYQEDMYTPGNHGNRMPGYMAPTSQGMGGLVPNMSSYHSSQSHGNYGSHGQQGHMVSSHQGTYSGPDMYQSHSTSQQYLGQSYSSGGSYTQGQGQFNTQSGKFGQNQGNSGYNSGQQQNPTRHHMRHSGSLVKNPQEVANSILQMAVSSYLPNQTVQVPLSKHRSAPYHIPKSPHYNVSGRSNSPSVQQQMTHNRQFVYPNSSPHHPARTSPISPAAMPMHSPVSHHSGQSIPSSSPRSIHSPTHGGTGSCCGSVRSPISAPSPGDMRSPCTIQSPSSMCSTAPINQQLHVSVPSGHQAYSGHLQSPTQKISTHYSPKTNPISPPGSQVDSPYTSISSIHSSPPQVEPYTSPPVRHNYVSDASQDIKDVSLQQVTNNPLQSLQKLCMLPETQVIDPKSVVNDACLPSPNSCDNPKNLNSVDTQDNHGNSESTSNSQSHECFDGNHCDESVLDHEKKDGETIHKCVDRNCSEIKDSTEKFVSVEKFGVASESVDKHDLKNHSVHKEEVKVNSVVRKEAKVKSLKGDEVVVNNVIGHAKKECENRFKKHLLNGDITSDEKTLNNCLDKIKIGQLEAMNNNVSCDKIEPMKSQSQVSPESALNKTNETVIKTDGSLQDQNLNKKHLQENLQSLNPSTLISENKSSKSPDKEINGKIRHHSNSSVKNISSDLENSSKVKDVVRTRVRKTRSLRGVPARLANAVYNSDSDDSDYHVRKDIGSTYSRQERETIVINSCITPNKSRKSFDSIVSENNSDDENIKSACSPRYEKRKLFDSKIDSKFGNKNPKSKRNVEGGNKPVEDNVNSEPSENIGQRLNPVDNNPGSRNPGNQSDSNDQSDCIVLSDYSDSYTGNKTNVQSIKSIPSTSKSSPSLQSEDSKNLKYSKRVRRKTSPVKYADVYYGEDFAIDSEEEMEFEKKNKKNRKSKLTARKDLDEDKESDIVFEYEGVDVHQLSQNSDDCCDDDNDDDEVGFMPETFQRPKPSTLCKTGSKEKIGVTKKKRGRPPGKSARPPGKSKGKIKKLENSKSRKKSKSFENDSFEDMKLKRTIDLMKKNKGKRKFDVCDKIQGPYIRVKDKDGINTCSIVNQPDEDNSTSDKKAKKKKTSVSVSTVHMSRLPSEKSICVPSSSLTEDENWNCALCGKHSSYKFLGDLFGPYYVEGNLPSSKQELNSSLSDTRGKRKRSLDETTGKRFKDSRRSFEMSKPREAWVHEDCVSWSDGVLLIGPKIYGLNEATQIASSMPVLLKWDQLKLQQMCSACKEKGAMMGCLHKGCSQKFHSYCAVETGCYLDEENFSLLCPKHKDKKLRISDASTSKL